MRIRTAIAASLLFVLAAAPSRAQLISLYPATESGYEESCLFTEGSGGGECLVAVVVTLSPTPILGVRFAVTQEEINWVPLYISSNFTWLGSFSDFSVGLGACTSAPVMVATLHYVCPGDSPCGIVALDASVFVPYTVDCQGGEHTTWAGSLKVNGVYDMPPGGFDPDCFCPAVGTESTTWGRVKALYR